MATLGGVGEAIGQMLPTALGVAISPLPIVAVVLTLVTPRGRENGPSFVGGWSIGLAVVGAKNLLLAVGGAAAISQTGISTGQEIVAWVIFAIVASIGVGAPVVIYFALGNRSAPLLERLENGMARNNAVIMAVLLLILGVKLIGDAITGFST